MKELIPTTGPVHFVARNDEGTVLHVGVTEVGQVTTTGQKHLITGDEAAQVRELEKFVGKRPSVNKEFDAASRSWVDKPNEVRRSR